MAITKKNQPSDELRKQDVQGDVQEQHETSSSVSDLVVNGDQADVIEYEEKTTTTVDSIQNSDQQQNGSSVSDSEPEPRVLIRFSGPYKNFVSGDITAVSKKDAAQLLEKRLATLFTTE